MGRHLVTDEQYDALLVLQEGLCAICRKAPPERRRLAVDHDHQTGTVRGLLCSRCNLGLGYFKDDPDHLRAATAYLERTGRTGATDPLVWKWFHQTTHDEHGIRIGWQGQIVGKNDTGYLVQTYSWLNGAPLNIELVPAGNLVGWSFYDSSGAMRDAYDQLAHRVQVAARRRLAAKEAEPALVR